MWSKLEYESPVARIKKDVMRLCAQEVAGDRNWRKLLPRLQGNGGFQSRVVHRMRVLARLRGLKL